MKNPDLNLTTFEGHTNASMDLPSVSSTSALNPRKNEQDESDVEIQSPEGFDDELCSICLQQVVDRAVIPRCAHEFCFECVMIWSEQSRKCPLCSQPIGDYLIHRIRSKFDYQKHFLNPLRSSPAPLPPSVRIRQVRPRAQRRAEREWGGRERRELEDADQLERAIEKRKWIYEHELYAKHVASNSYTRYRPYPSPSQFAASQDLISRTTAFLRRELRVWVNLDVEFLTTFIISLMKAIDIRSESAVKLLAEFLDMDTPYLEGGRHVNAEHFAHEVYCYLRSPYRDLFVYDSVVQYDVPDDVVPPAEHQRSFRWSDGQPRQGSPPSYSRSRSRSPQDYPDRRRTSPHSEHSGSRSWSPSGRQRTPPHRDSRPHKRKRRRDDARDSCQREDTGRGERRKSRISTPIPHNPLKDDRYSGEVAGDSMLPQGGKGKGRLFDPGLGSYPTETQVYREANEGRPVVSAANERETSWDTKDQGGGEVTGLGSAVAAWELPLPKAPLDGNALDGQPHAKHFYPEQRGQQDRTRPLRRPPRTMNLLASVQAHLALDGGRQSGRNKQASSERLHPSETSDIIGSTTVDDKVQSSQLQQNPSNVDSEAKVSSPSLLSRLSDRAPDSRLEPRAGSTLISTHLQTDGAIVSSTITSGRQSSIEPEPSVLKQTAALPVRFKEESHIDAQVLLSTTDIDNQPEGSNSSPSFHKNLSHFQMKEMTRQRVSSTPQPSIIDDNNLGEPSSASKTLPERSRSSFCSRSDLRSRLLNKLEEEKKHIEPDTRQTQQVSSGNCRAWSERSPQFNGILHGAPHSKTSPEVRDSLTIENKLRTQAKLRVRLAAAKKTASTIGGHGVSPRITGSPQQEDDNTDLAGREEILKAALRNSIC